MYATGGDGGVGGWEVYSLYIFCFIFLSLTICFCYFLQYQVKLPEGYSYHACDVTMQELSFTVTLRLESKTREEFEEWLDWFQQASFCTWRVKKTVPVTALKIIYKVSCFVCS